MKYFHFSKWECYQNGILRKEIIDSNISKSVGLLSNQDSFMRSLIDSLLFWPHSTKQFLLDRQLNRRAFCGRFACLFNHGASEREVRIAWWEVSEVNRVLANKTADRFLESLDA